MAVSRQCVRISLFQCAPLSDTSVHQAHRASQADGRPEARHPLFRSRSADYRGDVLIPLVSIASSSLQSVHHKTGTVKLHQLRDGLEGRLSTYCVLHVPASRTRSFVEEHRLSPSSLSLTPPAAGLSAPEDVQLILSADEEESRSRCEGAPVCLPCKAQFRCCARCSSSVVAEAAAISSKAPAVLGASSAPREAASNITSNAPWICINQLQRMTARSSDTTSQTPSSSSLQSCFAPSASTPPMRSVEEWMQQQHDSTDMFLTSSEAESVGAVNAEDDGAEGEVEGGACYAAFFSLTMLPAAERAKRLMSSLARSSAPAAGATASKSPTVFTVRTHHHTLRMGLPLPTSLDKADSFRTLQSPLTLREAIIDRLRLQRRLRVERLLDTKSGAAVLPCESAPTLLAAQVVSLEAECRAPLSVRSKQEEGLAQRLAPRSPLEAQQQSSSTPTNARAGGPSTETASDLSDHLVSLRAHHHGDQYYYDGADAYGWAEWRTLISVSELASESELRLSFTGSRGSSQMPRYSSTPPSTASSDAASSVVLLFAESSSSHRAPRPQDDDVCAVQTGPLDGVGVAGSSAGMELPMSTENGTDDHEQYHDQGSKVSGDQGGSTAFFSMNGEEATTPLSPMQGNLEGLRDSLCDMNDVFIYEDEETVVDVDVVGTGDRGDGSSGNQRQERRSSLVWSTPVARGSGAGRMLTDTGFSATPLTYRTSTQLSLSPPASPVAVPCKAAMTAINEQPTQRMIFATSPSSTASLFRSAHSGTSVEDEEVIAFGSGDDGAVTSAGEVHDGDVADQGAGDATREFLMSVARASVAPPASTSSAMSSTDSSIASASHSSNMSSSSCARSDHPSTPSCEATSSVRREGAAASSSEMPVAPLSLVDSAPAFALSSPSPHKPRHAVAPAHPDEQTTLIAPCSAPPPSRRCTSEHELRSHLHSLNPVATQHSSERASQGAPVVASQRSTDGWDAKNGEKAVLHGDDGGSSSERKRARGQEMIALDSTDARPMAVLRGEGARAAMVLSSSTSAGGIDDDHSTNSSVSTPSTTVATRSLRMRSPIILSPGELSRMALNMAASDAIQTRSSSTRHPLARTVELDLDDASEVSEDTLGHYGYGGYVASYTVPGRDDREDLVRDDEWGHGSRHSSTHRSHMARPTQHCQSTVSQPVSQSSCQQGSAPLVVATTTEEAAATMDPAHHLDGTKRCRSLSFPAPALETWICFTDDDSGGTESDPDHHMLVTQQGIPVYTTRSDSSAESDGGGSASDEDSNERDTDHT
ncbi:conserved hypothetical protein [Leishmania major strain Friedlin]|uniref:Uncharacterized protein n=1 Tax=Leishmania major TaxID=5664 RepID=Q4Q7A8_LEIMA|nr:conserved hypothetical protein [Leishmania major strain Friedlin]CAG9578419.1 hypothetical_protein_-_conserved [Leishmania major strain Friedlin]CAJ06348.1 conserved hypothetical protein [Leishmania major strain Friedlin]|eukprot:XP_001684790.1 conserved hypothetical protein [Leishmania major strain Friedlin]